MKSRTFFASILAAACLLSTGVEAAGPPKRSTYFDGTGNASMQFAHRTEYDATIPMTVEAWIYRYDANRCETIVSHDWTASFWLGCCSKLRFYRSGAASADADVNIAAQCWTHVAASYDGSRVHFYTNGQPAGDKLLSNAGANFNRPLMVGSDPSGYRFLGNIDEVRVWSVARSQAEIQANMFQELRGMSNLVAVFAGGSTTETVSGAAGTAGSGTSAQIFGILPRDLIVPRAVLPITVDGFVTIGSEYAGAEQMVIRYSDGVQYRDAVAYLMYQDDVAGNNRALYVGVTGIREVEPGGDRHNSFIGVNLDPNYSQDAIAQTNDFRVRGWLDASTPTWGFGDGVGNFGIAPPPVPSSLWQAAYSFSCSGDLNPPCMEFRIDRALLGSFSEADGIMIGHFNIGPSGRNFLAPGDAVRNSPATWPQMTYGDASAALPTAQITGHVFDGDRTRHVAGHQVDLFDADTGGAALYTRFTTAAGAFNFTVPVPAGRRLRVQIATCTDCRYLSPELGSGIAPDSSSGSQVTYPACASGTCNYATVDFFIRKPVGPVAATGFTPNQGAPHLVLRNSPFKDLPPDTVRISGSNLHPYTRLYLYNCLSIPPEAGCNENDAYFEAPVIARGGDDSWVDVQVPEVPQLTWGWFWKWVVRDDWIRPGRVEWTRVGAADDYFRIAPARYPLVHGFEFENQDDTAGLGDFDGCFGNNAYICLGAFGSCLCRVRDPFYLLYYPIYKIWIDGASGSCNGMSATSLLFAHRYLNPADYQPGVNYAAGFSGLLPPAPDSSFPRPPKPESYGNPACGPRYPQNLWARIRSNHGVQASDEFIQVLLDEMDGAGLGGAIPGGDPTSSISGNPVAVLNAVRSLPAYDVLSMVPEIGRGHVVVPYAVQDGVDTNGDGVVDRTDLSRIFVYDNNLPERTDRYIEIDTTANRFRFPRQDDVNNTSGQWTGTGLYRIPMSVWINQRHAPGLTAAVRILSLLVFGDADGLYTGTSGGQWGWRTNGTTVDTLLGAKAVVPTGIGDSITRNVMLAYPETNTPPTVQVNVRGPHYFFHAAHGGVALQLEQTAGVDGDRDAVSVGYANSELASFRFTPQRTASQLHSRIGMVLGDRQSAVFDVTGFALEGGKALEFKALPNQRGIELRNDTSSSLSFTLSIQSVDGESSIVATNDYVAPLMPTGAVQRLIINDWPVASQLRSEIDLDRDGTPDRVAVFISTEATPIQEPPNLDIRAVGAQIVLSWPLTTHAYYAQRVTNLGANENWTTLNVAPVIVGGRNEVTLSGLQTQTFFRLHQ